MHGGARGSGAPANNSNALGHGLFTKAANEARRANAELVRNIRRFMAERKEDS